MNQVIDTTTTTVVNTAPKVNSRSLTVIVLIILLTVLSAVGILVAITLQGSQAPDDSLAWPGPVCEGSNCTCENGGALCGNSSTCEAGRGCVPYSELGSRNCQQYINDVCNPIGSQCAAGGSVPVGGQACCEGLTQCPGQGNVCTGSCNGSIGGQSGVCNTGQWVLYECKGSCNPAGGCQTPYTGTGGNTIPADGRNEDEIRAEQFVNGSGGYTKTSTCYVRQADCSTTSGVNLVFRSSYSCSNQCTSNPTTGQTGQTGNNNTGTTQPMCGDAICNSGEFCEKVSPGSTNSKVCKTSDTGSSPTGTSVECSTACMVVNRACLGVTRSADTLAPGVGNKTVFTLKFRDERNQYPYYPGVYMRVSSAETNATAVGRDANATSSKFVSIMPTGGRTKVENSDGSFNYEYKFEWEAASTTGADVAAGTYVVQFFKEDGAQLFADNASCESSITISEEQVENPLFTIVKLSSAVCESDNDSRIDYTVRVTNTGPVEGVIDFVRDTLDPDVIAAGIVPSSIVPSYGIYASGVITWTGAIADRTYASLQSKDFTYSITIPADMVEDFEGTGIDNQAVVQYDTEDTDDNTDSFTLNTPVACSTTVIPNTGLFDDGRFLILGAFFVLAGIYVYRRQYILEHSFEFEIERKLSKKADEQD